MNHWKILIVMAAVCVGLPTTSNAQQWALTAKSVNLRAGPAKDYPAVAMLPAGTSIAVEACLSDYRWCDVVAGPNRGWVYAANIAYPYQGANVSVLTYGAVIGIGVVAFSAASY